ncbi:MAG: choline-sulfatase [Clostridiales bacterium]|nr:choline-sulfatase [Clostridiales bacterium]
MRILYLDLDTLRPDHLGCYGYHRNTSPNIDRIAERAVRFDNYYCSDAPCLPSRTALMSGRFGIHTGVVNHGGTAADMRLEGEKRDFRDKLWNSSLPGFLRSAGLKTVSISPFAERHSSWTFYSGFNEMYNTGKGGAELAGDITPTALKWIEANAKEDNWFLHINYWDPHTPYRTPDEFGNPFENDPIPDWLTQEVLDEHIKMAGPHTALDLNMYNGDPNPEFPQFPGEIRTMDDLKKVIDGYDRGIRYMDQHIGMVLDALNKQGVLDDLVIIISADHGENMGELGIYSEHATADKCTCRIPMIIKWPDYASGYVDKGLHYNLDLGPTLAEMLNKEPVSWWDGQSYASVIKGGKDCGRPYLIISQCAHVCQRSVRFGPWLYIRTYHDGYHLFPEEMLFDIEHDPHERYNIAVQNPRICMEGVYYLNQWHDNMMRTMEHDVDPLWTVMKEGGPYHAKGHLKRYCQRLEQTGRGYAIPELKKRHPQEFE